MRTQTFAVAACVLITGCEDHSMWPHRPGAGGTSDGDPADASPEADASGGDTPTDAAPGADAAPDPDPDPEEPWDPGTPLWCGTMYETGDILFDSGHGGTIVTLIQEGTRLLSSGAGGWVLWDTATRSRVIDWKAGIGAIAGLASGVLVVQDASTVRLVDAANGQLLSTVTTAQPWPLIGLASDGSYLWAANESGLSAWSTTTGTPLLSRTGDYSTALLFAAPGEIRVALGPAGASVIQRIVVADGSSTTTAPFDGTFQSWFVDGDRFLTTAGTAVRVYTPDAVLEQLWAFPTTPQGLTGQGNFVWSRATGELRIYPIGSASVAYSTPLRAVAVHGNLLATLLQGTLTISDLGGTSLEQTQIAIPQTVYGDKLAIDDAGAWSVGGDGGVVWDSEHALAPDGPQPLSCGAVDVAGSRAGQVAVATAAGRIFDFDVSAGTRVVAGEVDFLAGHVELSSDGGLLAGEGVPLGDCDIDTGIPRSVRVFTMPSGALHQAWPCEELQQYPVPQAMFHLAAGSPTMVRNREVWDLLPTVELAYAASTGEQGKLSPDGLRIATTNRLGLDPDSPGERVTYIHEGGTLVATPAGLAVGWIDDSRLLVQLTDGASYTGTRIVDPLGAVLASPALPSMLSFGDNGRFIPVDATRIYIPRYNAIYSLVDGSQVWASAFGASGGDIAGPYVVSASVSRAQVHLEAY